MAVALYPFEFDFARAPRLYSFGTWGDVAANIAAFVPFGFAFAAAAWSRRPIVTAVGYCVALSACIEMLQVFVPQRFPQISDVVCNGIGCAVGLLIAHRRTRRVFQRSGDGASATIDSRVRH